MGCAGVRRGEWAGRGVQLLVRAHDLGRLVERLDCTRLAVVAVVALERPHGVREADEGVPGARVAQLLRLLRSVALLLLVALVVVAAPVKVVLAAAAAAARRVGIGVGDLVGDRALARVHELEQLGDVQERLGHDHLCKRERGA